MKVKNVIIGTLVAGSFLFSCSPKAETENTVETTKVMNLETEEGEIAEVQTIELNQVPGAFTNGDLTLKAGTYNFNVVNSGVDHEVGLVVAPKKTEITQEDHLPNAYVTETVKDGESKKSQGDVVLAQGEYVYFCPLNPTEQYTITVE